ncbi:hypothetical protein HMPREF1345_01753 [Enterococcus faecium TX1337RF]|nr:hypothetical protein HMPREF1345_01753 [Enterococcus faecium TX1337RF]
MLWTSKRINRGEKMNNFKKKFVSRFLNMKNFFEKKGDYDAYNYVLNLEKQTYYTLRKNDDNDFWTILPKMLSIDSKLSLLEEFINLDIEEFCGGKELINMIESDYHTYYKESCGYKVDEQCPQSIIFYVE